MSAARRRLLLAGVLASALATAWLASAQRFDPRRPRTLLVGPPRANAATDRVDGQRSGLARAPLPHGPLRVVWRRPLAFTLDRAPLVLASGDVVVVGGRGDVVTLGDDGVEKQRVNAGTLATGAATLTSDGTLVFVSPLGEAVGVRGGAVRFRTRIGGDRTGGSKVSPLPLEDGGVVLAVGAELVALDSEGNIRVRRGLPEAAVVPLVDARGMVVAVAASGAAYGWTPDREPTRIGSFGGPVDEGVAFDGERALLAVVANRQLVALDLDRGVASPRATPAAGVLLGPPTLARGLAHVFVHGTSTTLAVAFDGSGHEAWSARVATFAAALAPDGGAAPVVVPPHDGALADASGTLAFATPSGYVGVVTGCAPPAKGESSGCIVDALGEAPCARGMLPGSISGQPGGRLSSGVAGLAPAGPGAYVVACESGTLLKVTSASAGE